MTLRLALIAALTLGFAAPLLAQSPKPGEAGAAACAVIQGPFGFCGTPPHFTLTPQADNPQVTAYYTTPEGIQVAVIVEMLGSADGLTVSALQQAALEILSGASGTPIPDIPILERSSLVADGIPRPNFVYRDNVGGIAYVYSNTIILLPNAVAQFVTIENGSMVMSRTHRAVHMRLLSNVQVNR